jgi:hypothetical protein
MVKPPSEVSPISEYVVAGPFGSSANAVTPTVVPAAEPSMTVKWWHCCRPACHRDVGDADGKILRTGQRAVARHRRYVRMPGAGAETILVGSATETTPVTASILKRAIGVVGETECDAGPVDVLTP